MVATLQRLLKTPRLKSDESFIGYILRLAEENGYSSPSWITSLANCSNRGVPPSFSFTSISSESFKLVAALSGATVSELAQIIYQPVDTQSYYLYLFFGLPIHRSFIQPRHPKVCPECLRETAYCRRVWEFALLTVCPIHKRMLIDECPNCKKPIKWTRGHVSSCKCKFDWREYVASPIQDYEMNLARVIHRLCGLSYGDDKGYFSQTNPALSLSLQDLARVVIFIAGQLRGISITTSWPLLFTGTIKDLHCLFTGAYYVFDDWPNHFNEFLNWWRDQGRNVVVGYKRLQSVLFKDFGKLYTGLYKILSASQFNFIRGAFVDYLLKEWEGCDLSSFAGNKSMRTHSKVKYVSKSDARRLLDADDEWLKYFIRTGTLKTQVRSKGMKRLIFINVADIARLLRDSP